MDYLFDIRKVSKLQLDSRGILDCDDVKKLGFKFEDGKIVHCFGRVDEVLSVVDLEDDDLSVSDHIDADEELSDELNDSETILFPECIEI
jgi:hypothetical protein